MFDQINKALSWLKNNNKINDYQYNVLQDYYRKNDSINVEVLRDELFKFGTDPSFVLSKISEIEESNIDVIEFDDLNVINSDYKNENVSNFSNDITLNTNNQFNSNSNFDNNISQETFNQVNNDFAVQEMNWIRGLHPDKIVNMTSKPHSYVLSGDGIEDIYVKVEGKNGIYQILPDIEMYTSVNDTSVSNQSESKGISLTKSTLAGRAMADKDQAAFTNILFFIFLSGLSVGVIFMVILNFFMK